MCRFMKFDENVYFKLQHLYNDLMLLQGGHFYENGNTPGDPSYHTLATRMLEALAVVEKTIKEEEKK